MLNFTIVYCDPAGNNLKVPTDCSKQVIAISKVRVSIKLQKVFKKALNEGGRCFEKAS